MCVCDQETPKREAKGPSWTISACEWMNNTSHKQATDNIHTPMFCNNASLRFRVKFPLLSHQQYTATHIVLWIVTITHYYRVTQSNHYMRGSSGSIVSDYGLDDRAIGVRSPAEAKDFSSNLCVQTGSGAPPSLLYNGYRGSFPRG
jgi:hypothetical protein